MKKDRTDPKYRLAIRIVNLRRALKVANNELKKNGSFGVLCMEIQGPTFTESKAFWKEVDDLAGGR